MRSNGPGRPAPSICVNRISATPSEATWVQNASIATVVLGRKAQPELVRIFHPALPCGQVVCQQIFFDGLRHEKPLSAMTTLGDQEIKLRFVFHALCQNGQTERIGQGYNASNNVLFFLRRFQTAQERSVDL